MLTLKEEVHTVVFEASLYFIALYFIMFFLFVELQILLGFAHDIIERHANSKIQFIPKYRVISI